MIDKNILLDKYSAPMGNKENNFIDYAKTVGISDYKQFIREFNEIQNMLYDYVYDYTEPNLQLSANEIELVSQDFCKEKFDWINNTGIKALNGWLIWMCWHEGILKKNE